MKTISKFMTNAVEIRISMTSSKDADFLKGTYKVTETPRKKEAEWEKTTEYYDFYNDAKSSMQRKINFWLK